MNPPVRRLEEVFDREIAADLLRRPDAEVTRDEKKVIQNLNKKKYQKKEGDGFFYVEGIYTRTDPWLAKNQIGRVYPKANSSIACLSSIVRETFCDPYYWDVDFVACHHQFALNLLIKFNLPHEHTKQYVCNRKETLERLECETLKSQVDLKNEFIQVLYGSAQYTENMLYQELNSLRKTLDSVTEKLDFLPSNFLEWKENIKKGGTHIKLINCAPHERQASLLAQLCFHMEWKCIEALEEFLIQKGRSVGMLIHDGLKIRKTDAADDKEQVESLLKDSIDYINQKTGIHLNICPQALIIKEQKTLKLIPKEKTNTPYTNDDAESSLEIFFRDHYFFKGCLYYFPQSIDYPTPEKIDDDCLLQSRFYKALQGLYPAPKAPKDGSEPPPLPPPTVRGILLAHQNSKYGKIPDKCLVERTESRAYGGATRSSLLPTSTIKIKNLYRPADWIYFNCCLGKSTLTIPDFEKTYLQYIANIKTNLVFTEDEKARWEQSLHYKQLTEYLVDKAAFEQKDYEYCLLYFLNLIGRVLFEPHRKPNVCLTMRNQMGGSGKTAFFEHVIEPLLGYQFSIVSYTGNLFGTFNNILAEKTLIILDDINLSDTKGNSDKMKSIITCKKQYINQKYKEMESKHVYATFIATTNKQSCFVYEEANMRRFPVIDCCEHRLSDEEIKILASENKESHMNELFLKYIASVYDPNFDFYKHPKSLSFETTKIMYKNVVSSCISDLCNHFYPTTEWKDEVCLARINGRDSMVMADNFFQMFKDILNTDPDAYRDIKTIDGKMYVFYHDGCYYRELSNTTLAIKPDAFYTLLIQILKQTKSSFVEKCDNYLQVTTWRHDTHMKSFLQKASEDPTSGFQIQSKYSFTYWFYLKDKKLLKRWEQAEEKKRIFTINVPVFKKWVDEIYSPIDFFPPDKIPDSINPDSIDPEMEVAESSEPPQKKPRFVGFGLNGGLIEIY